MTRPRQGRTAFFRSGGFLLVWCCFLWGSALGEVDISLVLEPGFPLENGSWLVPVGLVDSQGHPLDVPEDDINLAVTGTPISGFDLGLFAPEQGGFPTSVAVLVDSGFPASGNDILAGFLSKVTSSGRKGLFICGSELKTPQGFGAPALAMARIEELLGKDEPGRLWDNILESIALLAAEGPVRRVLFIVSAGGESLSSEHPLATCVEAAGRSRVAVHYLELPGDPGGASRLRNLARNTGGVTTKFTGQASLSRALTVVEKVQSLTVAGSEHSLPAELTVGFGFSDQVIGTVTVAEPKALSGPAVGVLVGLALAVLAVGGGGFVLFRTVTKKSGLLVVNFQGERSEVFIPRAGVTIGSGQDNVLALADNRVARHHAVIREKAGEVIITDLRSATGTIVNGHTVRNAVLRDGDRVALGGAVEMIFWRELGSKQKQ